MFNRAGLSALQAKFLGWLRLCNHRRNHQLIKAIDSLALQSIFVEVRQQWVKPLVAVEYKAHLADEYHNIAGDH